MMRTAFPGLAGSRKTVPPPDLLCDTVQLSGTPRGLGAGLHSPPEPSSPPSPPLSPSVSVSPRPSPSEPFPWPLPSPSLRPRPRPGPPESPLPPPPSPPRPPSGVTETEPSSARVPLLLTLSRNFLTLSRNFWRAFGAVLIALSRLTRIGGFRNSCGLVPCFDVVGGRL